MPFTERTPEKLHHMLITDEEQQEKACIVSSCPSSLIENRSPREKCGPSFFAQFECAPLSSIIWRGVILCLSIDKTVMNEAADGAGSRTVNG
jgi:hypothetical protein